MSIARRSLFLFGVRRFAAAFFFSILEYGDLLPLWLFFVALCCLSGIVAHERRTRREKKKAAAKRRTPNKNKDTCPRAWNPRDIHWRYPIK
jgi:hypothetical protein